MNSTRLWYRKPAALALLTLLAVLAAGGCGRGGSPVPPQSPTASPAPFSRSLPTGVKDPAVLPASPSPVPACEPRRSYRPAFAPPANPDPTLARILERRELRVGTSQTGYLMSFQDRLTGDMAGFEVEIARDIARELGGDGIRITFVEVTARNRKQAIEDGEVDIMLRAVAIDCVRWKETAFSAEYLTSGQTVLVSKNSSYKNIESLGGRKVCAAEGSTNLAKIATIASRPTPVSASNITDCMLLLQQGYVDAVSSGDVVLAGLAQQDLTTHLVGPRFTDEPIGVAMSLGAIDLVRIVNRVLERRRLDGSWDKSYAKWLEPSLGPSTAPVPQYRD